MSTGFRDEDQPEEAQAGAGSRFEVDARWGAGLQIGDQGTQYNYFIYQGTLFYGLMPPPLLGRSGTIAYPYRGLSPFAEQDGPLFYGRDRAVAQLLDRMSRCLDGTGLLVVSGVSGAGKSSLVRAGALPRLREAGLSAALGAATWPRLVLTPGSRPLEALAVSAATVTGANAPGVLGDLTRDPGGFVLTARQAALARLDTTSPYGGLPGEAGQRRVLLVVDQAEQLFTQCDSEDERLAFITALHAAATAVGDRDPAALVVLVVRADFEARLAEYPLLSQAVQDRYLLTAMNELELRTAITQPAKEAGSHVEADLVDELLREMRTRSGRPGAIPGRMIGTGVLPLLSHALDQAWRLRADQALTLADYARTGGIEGAVASSAHHALNQLPPARQAVARQVLTRLVTTTGDGIDVIDTAVRATRAEPTEGRNQAGRADVQAVLEAFAAERLLTLDRDSVEISHEALLAAPLLQDWLAETRGDRAVRTWLETIAGDWSKDRRDSSYLYGSARLEATAEAADRIDADARQAPLSQVARDFLKESRRAIARQLWRRRSYTTILIVLVVGLAVATVSIFQANQTATQQRDNAISGELASKSEVTGDADAAATRLESMAAAAVNPSTDQARAQARYAMLRAAASPEITTLTRDPGPVNAVAFSPQGTTLATGDAYGTIELWNARTGKKLYSLNAGGGPYVSMAFSPNGTTLVTAASHAGGSTVDVWNVATGKKTLILYSGSSNDLSFLFVSSVAFNRNGTTLAIAGFSYVLPGGDKGTVELWNMATGKKFLTLYGDNNSVSFESVAFSPQGTTLATSSDDGTVELWNTATRKMTYRLNTGSDQVNSIAFSPDVSILATGDNDGTVELWKVATGKKTSSLTTGSDSVKSVAFSQDGTTLATGDNDGTIAWNMATDLQVGNLGTDLGPVNSVAFAAGGETLATGDNDGTVRLWNATSGQIHNFSAGSDDKVNAGALSPDGSLLAVGDNDGTVGVWNVATRKKTLSLRTTPSDVGSVGFSPDSATLITEGYGGSGEDSDELWSVATGRVIHTVPTDTLDLNSAALSPDGTILAMGETGGSLEQPVGTVELWNVATRKKIRALRLGPEPAALVVFSPDGKTLATSLYNDGTVELWNVATGKEVRSLKAGSDTVSSVAFDRDGTTLAASDDGGTVALWDMANGQQTTSLDTDSEGAGAVAFSPDGKTLAMDVQESDGNTVELWDLDTGQLITSLDTGSGPVESVAFSRDGTALAAGYGFSQEDGGDSGVTTWNVSYLVETLPRLCAQVGGSLTLTEWRRYVPVGPSYQNVCAQQS